MFRQLANNIGDANQILELHPSQLIALMDDAWNNRVIDTTDILGNPNNRTEIPGLLEHLLLQLHPTPAVQAAVAAARGAAAGAPQTGSAAVAAQAVQAAAAAVVVLGLSFDVTTEVKAAAQAAQAAAQDAASNAGNASVEATAAGNAGLIAQANAAVATAGILVARAGTLVGALSAANATIFLAAAQDAAERAQATAATALALGLSAVEGSALKAATEAAKAAVKALLVIVAAGGSRGASATVPPASLPTPTGATAAAAAAAHLRFRGGFALRARVRWDHLIYAYMIENTRIYEIFRRVLHELLHGERLGTPTRQTQLWMRSTEELFYRDPPPFSISAVNSYVRPDLGSSRRNAYHRMFGMDLNHGTDDNKPYPYVKADAANNEFVSTFEDLLREVWIGIVNERNAIGPNPTDNAKIADQAEKLHDMLITRRQNGNLSREEFVFVSMMSWFHLTVDSNLPVIVDLRAEAASPEQRLFKIAQRVTVPAHGLSKSYFDIADAISTVLIAIETRNFNDPRAAEALYRRTLGNPFPGLMTTIITHWSAITGRDMKASPVTPQWRKSELSTAPIPQREMRPREFATNGARHF